MATIKKNPLLSGNFAVDLADIWRYAVDEQDRKGCSFKDLMNNFGDAGVLVIYNAYKKTLKRRLSIIAELIDDETIYPENITDLREYKAVCDWLDIEGALREDA